MWMGSQIKLPRSWILKPEKDVPVFMCVCVYSLSGVDCFATPWTIALQAPLFVGLPRPEYWSELPFPSPGDRPKPKDRTWISCTSGGFFTAEPPGKPSSLYTPMFMLCTLVIQVSKKKKSPYVPTTSILFLHQYASKDIYLVCGFRYQLYGNESQN